MYPVPVNAILFEEEDIVDYGESKYRMNRIVLGADDVISEEQMSNALLNEKKELEEGIYRRSDLLKMGYPPAADEDKKKDDIYIVYRLEPQNTEPEWLQYHWQMSEVTGNRGNRSAVPEPVKLSELMLKARK